MPDADAPPLHVPAIDLGADATLLAEMAVAAGLIALGYFRKDPKVWTKPGDSPVSEADFAADQMLRTKLTAARPDYGWLSEETADSDHRLDRRRVFVVDPIDGTRAFLAGDPVWAVSVAVVEDGRPIAAALYQPATDDLLTAALGRGAWRGATRLSTSTRESVQGARVAGPRKWLERPDVQGHGMAMQAFVPSLALRIARVADGRLDMAFASARAHDWDLAAADLLVHEAGGRLASADGSPVRYNGAVPRHPPLAAAAPGIAEASLTLLAAMTLS